MAKETKPKARRVKGKASQKSLRDVIEKKAYEIYEHRCGENGNAIDDWLEAEMIILKKEKH